MNKLRLNTGKEYSIETSKSTADVKPSRSNIYLYAPCNLKTREDQFFHVGEGRHYR